MNRASDIGENLAIVLVVGLMVVTPLVFTGWLLKQALSPPLATAALPSQPPARELTVTEWTQAVSENVRVCVERMFTG